MKKTVLCILIAISFSVNAQNSISGTFTPAKDFKWLIAYRLKPGTQNYVADTAVKNGVFDLKIPENSVAGTYRLVYAVPQEEFYFDVIYNGKEDISLAFDSKKGVSFINSKDNILFDRYFKEINNLEQQIVDFYTTGNTNEEAYYSITKQMQDLQKSYEIKSKGLMASHFIKSNKPYVPEKFEAIDDYINHKKESYFNTLEIENPVLQASGFLTNKLVNFVFTAIPLEISAPQEREEAMNANVDIVNKKIAAVDLKYRVHLFYTLWAQATAGTYNLTSDYIYDRYLKALAKEVDNQEITNHIEEHNRLRLGAMAPEIKWTKNKITYELSKLQGAEKYVLVFWSSTCSHCLRELPALHDKLKNNESIKVIAVGLEHDDLTWKPESAKMPHFEHAIALGKWDSEYADLYAIKQTPSYFILDKNKKFIAKPENDKEVIELLEKK